MEKDKRTSKLFGSRISSIFNPHTNPNAHDIKSLPQLQKASTSLAPKQLPRGLLLPQRPAQPQATSRGLVLPKQHIMGAPDPVTPNQARSPRAGVSPSPRPLLLTPFNNRNSTTSTGTHSLQSDGSMSVLRPMAEYPPNLFHFDQIDEAAVTGREEIVPQQAATQSSASGLKRNLTRKPPPEMVDATGPQQVERMALAGSLRTTPMNQTDKDVRNDLQDIIGTLENEIHFLSPDANSRPSVSRGPSDELTTTPLNIQSPQQVTPSPEFKDFSDEFSPTSDPFASGENSSSLPSIAQTENSVPHSSAGTVPYPIDILDLGGLGLESPGYTPVSPTFPLDRGNQLPRLFGQYAANEDPFQRQYEGSGGGAASLQMSLDTANSSTYSLGMPLKNNSAFERKVHPTTSSSSSGSKLTPTMSATHSLNNQGGTIFGGPVAATSSASGSSNIFSSAASMSKSDAFPRNPPQTTSGLGHRKTGSITSIMSSNSYRNVSLAALKKTLNLKPGEGERSNYVYTIRKSAGTSYNDNPPGKWKLPIGILPVDKNANYAISNGKYMRLGGGMSGRSKKTSGVELKHGHLAPRLLAAEVDDTDSSIPGINSRLGRAGTNMTGSTFLAAAPPTRPEVNSGHSSFSSTATGQVPGAATATIASVSRNNSLARTVTEGSLGGGVGGGGPDSQSIVTGGDSSLSGRTKSISSGSSGSISDAHIGYYQHPGYKYGDDEDGVDDEGEGEPTDHEMNNETPIPNGYGSDYDESPRLVLANPDYSDSE